MERQMKGGRWFKDRVCCLCRQKKTEGKHMFPRGQGTAFPLLPSCSLFPGISSSHSIFELRLDVFQKMRISSHRDGGLLKA